MNCWKYLLMIISIRQSIIKTFIMFSFNGIPTFLHPQDLPGGAGGKEPTCQCRRQEMRVWSLGWEDSLVKGMATQPSILAWRIPWTEEPRWATVHGVTKSWTRLSDLAHMHAPLPTDTHTHQVLPFDFQKITFKIYFKDILHTKDRNYLYIFLFKS